MSEALKSLMLQPSLYAKIHIQDKAYIVTKGDIIHLPVTLKHTAVGDALRVTNISTFGSRDYTLSQPIPASRSLDTPRKFLNNVHCEVTVVEHTKQPLMTTIKKKRRNRHAKAIKTKQPYTVLRVSELKVM